MAEYRDAYQGLHDAGAEVVAVSVDDAERSAAVKHDLALPFPILSDRNRETVQAFGVFNKGEKGGIAVPSVFVIDRAMTVRFRVIESVATRVRPSDLIAWVRALAQTAEAETLPRPRTINPGLRGFLRAMRNSIRHGVKQPR